MLKYSLLRNHAGIILFGDYETLSDLHSIIHDVNERSPLVHDVEGPFLALAYDVRKAYEKQRRTVAPPELYPEIGVRYGVEILWPMILVQQRILRISLAFMDHSKLHQALTYALEAVIESAIAEDFGDQAASIKERWLRIDPGHPWPEEKVNSRTGQFCVWTKAERRRHFAGLLDSLDPMYPSFYELRAKRGETGLISPADLDAWEELEWPDPKW